MPGCSLGQSGGKGPGRDSVGVGMGMVGPNQEPGPWGAGCFHGQAGNCQVYSSDEMWQQIK